MAARFFWAKKWAESFADSTARKNKGLEPPKKNIPMIHFVDADLKDVFEKGKHFNWPQPVGCPRCNHYRVWGHGFVERIFDSFCRALLIKRFRCPNCGCVLTCRPSSHFSRIQSPRRTIRHSLSERLLNNRWPPDISSPRQRHWLANLKRKARAYLTDRWGSGLLAAYDRLIDLGRIPVSCAV